MSQSHFSEDNSHFFLKPFPNRRKIVRIERDPTKKPKHFTRRSGMKKGVLTEKVERVRIISGNRKKIFVDDRLYFIINFSDSIISWKSVQAALESLKGKITKVYNDTTIKLAVKPEDYEKFAEAIEKNRSLILDVREAMLPDKFEESFLEKLEKDPEKFHKTTIEVSDLSGLTYNQKLSDALESFVTNKNGKIELGYSTDKFAVYSASVSFPIIKEIAEQVEIVESIEPMPEIALISYNDPIDPNVSLASVVSLSKDSQKKEFPIVGAIDSGVNKAHAILQGNVADTYDFKTNAAKPCDDEDGHGSMVSGIIVYGGSNPTHTQVMANLLMVKAFEDAKPLGDIMKIIDKSTSYFSNKTKVFNLSFSAFGPNRSLTKMLDDLIYSRNLIIVACAGNITFDHIKYNLKNQVHYPDYLMRYPIYFPGDSPNSITVGASTSITSNFVPKNSPSPFTRTGTNEKSFKPDVLADGGNLNLIGDGNGKDYDFNHKGVGINSASSNDPIKLSEGVGTSFASPAVATIAGNIIERYGSSSPYLVKALVLSSCSQLENTNGKPFEPKIQGFGVPDYVSAVQSTRWRVSYLLQGTFDGLDPLAVHTYKFLFPNNADKVTVTFVVGKPPNSEGYFRYKLVKGGSKRSSNLTPTSRYGPYQIKTTGQATYDVRRGGKTEWTIDIIPHFDKTIGMDKSLKYGCVITLESKKNLDIHTPISAWIKSAPKRVEKVQKLEEAEKIAQTEVKEIQKTTVA